MIWDVPHHRGMGFPLTILRPVGVWSILSNLNEQMHLRPADLKSLLEQANEADAPLMGMRDLPGDISETLAALHDSGLVVRCVGGHHGGHTRYDLTRFGAELVRAVWPLTAWAMADFDFVVAATRVRLGLPALDGPAPRPRRPARPATGMAISLLSGLWSDTVMVYVDSARPPGIGALQLEDAVNAAIEASGGDGRVGRRLHLGSLYRTLHRLEAKGLLERRVEPPRTFYLLTGHGRGLMRAWWQVAEGFGIPHDEELFSIIAKTTSWFPDASRD